MGDVTLQELSQMLDRVVDPLVDDWDPLQLGLAVSKLEYPDLDIGFYTKTFETWVAQARLAIPSQGTLRQQTQALAQFFKDELKFEGDRANYYNLKNSFLSDVLVRRKGIPISLSLAFMALARGVGLKCVGVAFPGHFLVKLVAHEGQWQFSSGRERAEDWRQSWFVDPFDGGTFLSVEDCEKRLFEWTRGAVPFGPEVLRVAHPRDMVSRILRNLRAILSEKEDLARLYWVLTALIRLCPQDRMEALRERGVLLARTARFQLAIADLKEYLSHSPDLEKRQRVEALILHFQGAKDQTN